MAACGCNAAMRLVPRMAWRPGQPARRLRPPAAPLPGTAAGSTARGRAARGTVESRGGQPARRQSRPQTPPHRSARGPSSAAAGGGLVQGMVRGCRLLRCLKQGVVTGQVAPTCGQEIARRGCRVRALDSPAPRASPLQAPRLQQQAADTPPNPCSCKRQAITKAHLAELAHALADEGVWVGRRCRRHGNRSTHCQQPAGQRQAAARPCQQRSPAGGILREKPSLTVSRPNYPCIPCTATAKLPVPPPPITPARQAGGWRAPSSA